MSAPHAQPLISDKFLHTNVQKEAEVLAAALAGKQLSGTSEVVSAYETALASFFGVRYTLALSSGTASLHTALTVLDATNGAEVLIPATAPVPSLLPLLTAGAIPVFVDCGQDHLGFDEEDLQRKITPRTRAALVVPMWGYPFSLEKTLHVLNQYHIPLIEDACQAHGTLIDGRKAGTWGRIGCLSTHDRKILATGEGGIFLTEDEDLAQRARLFTQLGGMTGKVHGTKYMISTLQAALGLARIAQIDANLRQRETNASHLRAALNQCLNLAELDYPVGCMPNYYAFVIRTTGAEMAPVIEALKERGIPSDITRYGYRVAYECPLFRPFFRERCPNAERLIEGITTVPVHPGLSEEEVQRIAHAFLEVDHLAR